MRLLGKTILLMMIDISLLALFSSVFGEPPYMYYYQAMLILGGWIVLFFLIVNLLIEYLSEDEVTYHISEEVKL